MRTLSTEIISHLDEEVTIKGWLHKKRLLGGLNFILIRDRSGLTQVLVEEDEEIEKLRGMMIGTVMSVTGNVFKDDRAPGGAEIHQPKISIEVPVIDEPPIEIDKPISHKSEHLDTLFDNRVLGLRSVTEQSIFRVRAGVLRMIRGFLTEKEFVEIQTPKLLAEAAEGGAEVFKLDYFDQEATLAQSPQLYKQIMVGVFERVFEIAPAYRAEPSATTRHMTELTMLDVEIGFIDSHEDVLTILEQLVFKTVEEVHQKYDDLLKKWNSAEWKLTPNFPRYKVSEVHEMYSKANNVDTTKEKDLTPDEEKWICEYSKKNNGCEAVFVTSFPTSVHKFYQMIDPADSTLVLTADLLFKGVEIATAPVREHRYDKLIEQMRYQGIDPDHAGFKYYLQAFRYGLPPHGGFGFGIDRFVEKIFNLNNVKEATLFPRDINRLTP